MKSGDTTLGGGAKAFPETSLGFAGALKKPDELSLETLSRRYWKPVYSFIRVGWAKSNEDAKDLAQEFFLWLLEGEALKRYDVARGGFRSFLKALLRRFVETNFQSIRL